MRTFRERKLLNRGKNVRLRRRFLRVRRFLRRRNPVAVAGFSFRMRKRDVDLRRSVRMIGFPRLYRFAYCSRRVRGFRQDRKRAFVFGCGSRARRYGESYGCRSGG